MGRDRIKILMVSSIIGILISGLATISIATIAPPYLWIASSVFLLTATIGLAATLTAIYTHNRSLKQEISRSIPRSIRKLDLIESLIKSKLDRFDEIVLEYNRGGQLTEGSKVAAEQMLGLDRKDGATINADGKIVPSIPDLLKAYYLAIKELTSLKNSANNPVLNFYARYYSNTLARLTEAFENRLKTHTTNFPTNHPVPEGPTQPVAAAEAASPTTVAQRLETQPVQGPPRAGADTGTQRNQQIIPEVEGRS